MNSSTALFLDPAGSSAAHAPLPDCIGVCYSGYRSDHSPIARRYPGEDQVLEDLSILRRLFGRLRLYDSGPHAERVLAAIRAHRLSLKVMLGAHLGAEESNPDCPWGGVYDADRLAANAAENDREIDRLIALARRYEDIVESVAVGNECVAAWSDHRVPVERLIEQVRRVRGAAAQPVTVCENHVPWRGELRPVAAELDFISIHSYPVWERRNIDEALECTRDDILTVAAAYPGRKIVVSEAGWTTRTNGHGIDPGHASPELQAIYCARLVDWAVARGVSIYLFEAFDEPWKGGSDPQEPEKHWGLYTVERQPKPAVGLLRSRGARARGEEPGVRGGRLAAG